MGRQLPEIDICGTLFYVDVQREELRQKDDPKNRISFMEFDQEADGYTFLYDKERCNTPEDKETVTLPSDRFEWVTLPALMELDPVGIALKYDIPLSVLCPEMDGKEPKLEDDDEDEEFPFDR